MRNGPEQGQSLTFSLLQIYYTEKTMALTKWLLWFSNPTVVLIDDSTHLL